MVYLALTPHSGKGWVSAKYHGYPYEGCAPHCLFESSRFNRIGSWKRAAAGSEQPTSARDRRDSRTVKGDVRSKVH